VAWAARRCVDATGAGIKWEDLAVGQEPFMRTGNPLPQSAASRLLKLERVLKAPLEGGYNGASRNPSSLMKELYGVFASSRRCRSFPGVSLAVEGLDLLVISQEGTAPGLLCDLDSRDAGWGPLARLSHEEASAATVRFVSRDRSMRFFEFGFALLSRAGRRKVTLAHKANTFNKSDGLWLQCAEEVSRRFPWLEVEDQLVDYLAMQIARSPRRYEAILANELFGGVIGDLATGLAGGVGMVPHVYYGEKGVIYTSAHGTAPKYSVLDRANPCAMILSASALLAEAGEERASREMESALNDTLASGFRTVDILGAEPGTPASTTAFTEAVISRISRHAFSADFQG